MQSIGVVDDVIRSNSLKIIQFLSRAVLSEGGRALQRGSDRFSDSSSFRIKNELELIMPKKANRQWRARSSTFTLDEHDLKMLHLSGCLSAEISSIKALRRTVENSRRTYVCVRLMDVADNLVSEVEFNNPEGHPPTVADLRAWLTEHFQGIGEGYEKSVEKAILRGHLGRRRRQRPAVEVRPPLYGAFRPDPESRFYPYWCIPLQGVTFTTTNDNDLNGIPLIPEFWSRTNYHGGIPHINLYVKQHDHEGPGHIFEPHEATDPNPNCVNIPLRTYRRTRHVPTAHRIHKVQVAHRTLCCSIRNIAVREDGGGVVLTTAGKGTGGWNADR